MGTYECVGVGGRHSERKSATGRGLIIVGGVSGVMFCVKVPEVMNSMKWIEYKFDVFSRHASQDADTQIV